jgi:iron complex outermembrane recepter protein
MGMFRNLDRRARMGACSSALALIAAAALGASAARAETAKPAAKSKDPAVGEIVVTAQFRQQNLQVTPLAITAVNAQMMDSRAQTRITDIAAQAPNVQLEPNPAGGGNSMKAFIRGVGQSDQDPALDPGVGIYVDDVNFGTVTGSIFDLLDLDRVEIRRGPQGTLSGMNSLGGAIYMYSKKPDGSNGGFIEGSLGSLSRKDFRGSADFTVVPDQLFVRLSGVSRHHDGYVTRLDYACVHPNDPYVISGAIGRDNSGPDCKIGTLGNQDMTALRLSARWTPTEKIEVNLTGDWTGDNSETQADTLLQAGEIIPGASLAYFGAPYDNRFVTYGPNRGDTVINNPYVSYANFIDPGVTYQAVDAAGTPGKPNGPWAPEPKDGIKAWGVSGTVDWQLAPHLGLKSITAYRHYVADSTDDNGASPVIQVMEYAHFTHEQFSQEGRFHGTALNDVIDYTVGGIYFHQKTVYQNREDDPFLAGIYGTLSQPTFDFMGNDPTVTDTEAGFGNLSWKATDKLTLEGGVRYTHERKSYTFERLNLDGVTPYPVLGNLNGVTGVYDGSHWDWRAVAQYQWTSDLMTYFSFSTGFKGGGVSPRPYIAEQVTPFGPETLNAYEVGFKSQWFDRRMRLNLAGFYNQYDNYQATPSVCVDINGNVIPGPFGTPLCGEYANVANATVKGVELETEIHPVGGLMIDGAISYLKFKFGQPFRATNAVIAGASAPGIGDLKWSIGVQYAFPFILNGTLTPRIDVNHTPGYCNGLNASLSCNPISKNQNYTLVNGRLTYRSADDLWSLSLEVTNMTDKLYYVNKFASSYIEGQPGMPREWYVTLRRSF